MPSCMVCQWSCPASPVFERVLMTLGRWWTARGRGPAHVLALLPGTRAAPRDLGHPLRGEAELRDKSFQRRRGAEGVHADDRPPVSRRTAPSRTSPPARRRRGPSPPAAAPGRGTPAAAARTAPSDGMLTTRALMPSAASSSYASTHSDTSLPVAIRITSGLPSGGVGQHVGALGDARRPAAYFVRSSVGSAWRVRTSAAGSCCSRHDAPPRLGDLVRVAGADDDQARDGPQRRRAARSAGASARPRRRRSSRA